MAPWTFSTKFPYGTQFIFRSLMFTDGEDGNLELLTQGSTPKHHVPVYGKAPYYPVNPSTSGGACSCLNPHAEPYNFSAMTSQEFLIGTPIFQPSAGTMSSSSLEVSHDRDSTEDYPKIGGSVCWNPIVESRRINMVTLEGVQSQNSSSRYPTIRGSEASDAWTPSYRLVQNLNPDFNVMWLQTIMEPIQRMVPKGSLLISLALQGAEAADHVIAAERSPSGRGLLWELISRSGKMCSQ
jgi:hypothetical protein